RVPVPRTDEPGMRWTLQARSNGLVGESASATIVLAPRDETPAQPSLDVAWDSPSAVAGDKGGFRAAGRDASDEPVTGLELRYWTGPDGTSPPNDAVEWEKVSTQAKTDATGSITAVITTPSTVSPRGTNVNVVVRGVLGGHRLDETRAVTVGPGAASLTA